MANLRLQSTTGAETLIVDDTNNGQLIFVKDGVETSIDEGDFGLFQGMSDQFLSDLAEGRVDMKTLALRELACRGKNTSGKWVGFDRSFEANGFYKTSRS